jgi:hypothetical protein
MFSSRGIFWKKVSVLLIVGCGARGLVVEEALLDEPSGSGGSGPVSGTGGSGGSGGSSADAFRFEDTQLEECQMGFVWSASDDRECNFRFNGRCYEGAKEVCACACPRARNSTCVLSGFLSDPENPLTVSCQPRR